MEKEKIYNIFLQLVNLKDIYHYSSFNREYNDIYTSNKMNLLKIFKSENISLIKKEYETSLLKIEQYEHQEEVNIISDINLFLLDVFENEVKNYRLKLEIDDIFSLLSPKEKYDDILFHLKKTSEVNQNPIKYSLIKAISSNIVKSFFNEVIYETHPEIYQDWLKIYAFHEYIKYSKNEKMISLDSYLYYKEGISVYAPNTIIGIESVISNLLLKEFSIPDYQSIELTIIGEILCNKINNYFITDSSKINFIKHICNLTDNLIKKMTFDLTMDLFSKKKLIQYISNN